MRILVLMGGDSPERDVSLVSGEAVVEALKQAGHQVLAVDTADSWKALPGQTRHLAHGIGANPPDLQELQKIDSERALKSFESSDLKEVEVIFLALHGGKGEDGTIQALLDLTGKPYTGSGVLASALAMDKNMSKKIFEREGILTPRWVYWDRLSRPYVDLTMASRVLRYPIVVKPNNQGSTVGVSVVSSIEDILQASEKAAEFSDQIIMEEFIPGREITVAVLNDQPLPVVEIVPEHGIYDYECKYTSGKSKYICPAALTSQQTRTVQEAGLKAFQALGCQSYARVDFRLSPEGKFYCLEVNTLPGMTEHSLVPKAAQAAGIAFTDLVDRIAHLALEKRKQGWGILRI